LTEFDLLSPQTTSEYFPSITMEKKTVRQGIEEINEINQINETNQINEIDQITLIPHEN
jgi:hypothetical protein